MSICDYCGEEPSTVEIPNPNLSMEMMMDNNEVDRKWKVCRTCKETIGWQRFLSIAQMLGNDKQIAFANKKLIELVEKTGKSIISAQVTADGKVSSIQVDKIKEE